MRASKKNTLKPGCCELLESLNKEQSGQMSVEIATLVPVVIAVALLIINALHFAEIVARFDRVAPNAVLVCGVVPSGAVSDYAYQEAVASQIQEAMQEYSCSVKVQSEQIGVGDSRALLNLSAGTVRYTCTLVYTPWPCAISIAGTRYQLPLEVSHEISLVVDRYRGAVIV